MKTVPLRELNEAKSAEIFKMVLKLPPPGKGIDIETMRRRMRVLDALDAAEGNSLDLEDADFATLKAAFNQVQWTMVSKEILTIADDLAAS